MNSLEPVSFFDGLERFNSIESCMLRYVQLLCYISYVMTTPPFYFILTVKSPIKHVVINVIQNYSNLIRLPFQSMKYVHNIIILYTPVKQCIVLIVHKVFKINLSDILFFFVGGVLGGRGCLDNYLSTSFWPPTLVTAAMYLIMILEASVFPAPDSP